MHRTGASRSPAASPARPALGGARGKRFVILASSFHESLSRGLIQGAMRTLLRHGAGAGAVNVVWVPGVFELPIVVSHVVRRRPRPDAVLALGALIRGDTPQYLILAHAVAAGLIEVSIRSGVPVTFGIVVAHTLAQARARSGPGKGNRGEESALAALGVLRLLDKNSPKSEVRSR